MSPSERNAPSPPHDVLRGTLDLLILKSLSPEPMHGWAIAQRLEQLSRDALRGLGVEPMEALREE